MNAYRDQYATIFNDGDGVALFAISLDPIDTLAAWAEDEGYPFTFLSDSGGVVGRAYGAFSEKSGLDRRVVIVIGPDGVIRHRQDPFRELDPTAYSALGAAVDSSRPSD
ncbi:MAG: redoxin domain-containing protein [Gemmatimonadales bacterium]